MCYNFPEGIFVFTTSESTYRIPEGIVTKKIKRKEKEKEEEVELINEIKNYQEEK